MATLENQTPDFVVSPILNVLTIVESYGWFILFGIVAIIYAYSRYKPSYDTWSSKQRDLKEQEEAKKNPDKTYQIQVSVEQARLNLQEKVNEDARKNKLRQEQLEEEKRQKNIEEWERHQQGKGYHSKYKPADSPPDGLSTGYIKKTKKKETLRNRDYNPLTGESGGSGSTSYRSSRRNVSGGG